MCAYRGAQSVLSGEVCEDSRPCNKDVLAEGCERQCLKSGTWGRQ